ncbi:MAG: phosphoenolpyruvate-utilizing N-terminal domain-containing protein, partial [Sulfurifustis sp.]
MLALHGAGVSDGISIGAAFVLSRELPDITPQTLPPDQIDAEVTRFQAAVDAARAQLLKVREQIPHDAPIEAASFIDTHV